MNLLESKFDKVEDRAGCACQNGVLQLAHFVVVQQIADALRGDLHVGVIVGLGENFKHQIIVIVFCHGKLLTSWLKPCILQDKALDILDTKKEKCSEPHPGSRDASRNGNRLEERRFSCILQAYPGKYRRYIQVCRS